MTTTSLAVVQLCARGYGPESLDNAVVQTRLACASADIVALPESYAGFGDVQARLPWAFDEAQPQRGPTVAPFVKLSRESKAVIVLGGTPERSADGRTFNTALVLRGGQVVAKYRKENLFDATLPGGQRLEESRQTAPGAHEQDVAVELGGFSLGLSICFDLRFPAHYQRLRARGANIMMVPSAFTRPTGEAHWEVLLRARAIETQSFVVAPAQCGEHGGGRSSWGHSLVVSPWGEVLVDAGEEPVTTVTTLDLQAVRDARARFGS